MTHGDPRVLGRQPMQSRNALELRNRMAQYAVPHTVEPLWGDLAGSTVGIRLGPVSLAFIRYGKPARIIADPTGESLCWTVPVGPMQVGMAGSSSELREGFFLDPDGPTVMLPDPDRGAVVITTETAALRTHLGQLLGDEPPPVLIRPGPSTSPTRGQSELAWRYVAQCLGMNPNPPGALRRSLGQTLLTSLIAELPQTANLLEQAPATRGARHLAQQAADWAAAHYASPVQVVEWATDLSMSVRHLQMLMQTHFGCTPTQYLLELRLERARFLLEQHPERSVTSIALESGFTHLGRFAIHFRERYGLSPTALRRRAIGEGRLDAQGLPSGARWKHLGAGSRA